MRDVFIKNSLFDENRMASTKPFETDCQSALAGTDRVRCRI